MFIWLWNCQIHLEFLLRIRNEISLVIDNLSDRRQVRQLRPEIFQKIGPKEKNFRNFYNRDSSFVTSIRPSCSREIVKRVSLEFHCRDLKKKKWDNILDPQLFYPEFPPSRGLYETTYIQISVTLSSASRSQGLRLSVALFHPRRRTSRPRALLTRRRITPLFGLYNSLKAGNTVPARDCHVGEARVSLAVSVWEVKRPRSRGVYCVCSE